ncbi:MAG TPA: glycosyltransferase family 39 protein [Candidatus Nanoarchaeia archaeon]|nr:glycosyltransferase family 39 protein [Candidatus Nanoarchaeia archaeon]
MSSRQVLFWIFAALVVVKLSLSFFVATPTIYSDEYLYAKLARSLNVDSSYAVHGILINGYPPLYPLVLSLTYFFDDMSLIYFFMKLLNAILSSLIIFPAYFFSRIFVSSKESTWFALLIGVLPSSFAYTPYLLSENVFFVLFFTTVYFLFRASTQHYFMDYLWTGVFLGLTLLTKASGLILFPLFAILFFRALYRRSAEETGLLIFSGLVAALLYVPWFLYTTANFGLSFSGLLGNSYSAELTNVVEHSLFFLFKNGIIWTILYLGVFIWSSALLFFLGSWFFFRRAASPLHKELLFFFCILFVTVLFFVVNHNLHGVVKEDNFLALSGRPIARYTDLLLPLLFLTGFLGLKSQKKLLTKSFIAPILILLLSLPLFFYTLLPVNNLSLTWLGTVQTAALLFSSSAFFLSFVYVLLLIVFSFLVIFLVHTLSLSKLLPLFCGFFLAVSLLSFGATIYNSQVNWYPLEQVQLGLWLKDHIPEDVRIVIDADFCTSLSVSDATSLCSSTGHTTLLGFWVNHDLIISETPQPGDYFISRDITSYLPQYATENHIYVYKVP